MKTKVTLKLNGLELLKKELEHGKVLDEIGEAVVDQMQVLISQGISPVKAFGRFKGYAAQRLAGSKPKNQLYPNMIPGKAIRPVNLNLSGKYLDTLGHKKRGKGVVEVGHMVLTDKQKKMFETHNEGKHPHVPQRKYLPTGKGENFVVTIERLIKTLIVKAIKRNL